MEVRQVKCDDNRQCFIENMDSQIGGFSDPNQLLPFSDKQRDLNPKRSKKKNSIWTWAT